MITSIENCVLSEYLILSPTAIDVVTVYVFHEPSLLSSLQDNGLTAVMLKALVVKEVSLHHINIFETFSFQFQEYLMF